MLLNCIVGGGEEGATVEPVEGGDKPCSLEETKKSRVIWIFRKLVDESL